MSDLKRAAKIVEVKVIPRASRNLIKEEGSRLKAYVMAAPEKGKANKNLIALLSSYFKVRPKDIRIVRGEHTPLKIVEINQ